MKLTEHFTVEEMTNTSQPYDNSLDEKKREHIKENLFLLCEMYLERLSNPNVMTSDCRIITQDEILSLIDWYLDKELGNSHKVLSFESTIRDGYRVQLTYKRKERDDECQ